jgi:hypothetical protein
VRLDKDKTTILDLSHKFYERSLIVYPRELRNDFGSEMMEVFDEQMSEAYSRSGFTGVLRAWFSITWEFVTVALPSRLAGRVVPIAAVAATLAFMVWFAGYIGYVMEKACPGCGH